VTLFLHGAGERGNDGLKQTEVGIGAAIRFDRLRFPAVVVMPQVPDESAWTEAPMPELAIAALNAATREFHGDRRHTYLTGLSMGGTGVWSLAAAYPLRFAALVPICGRVMTTGIGARSPAATSFEAMAKQIGPTIPIWIFHGRDDPVVPVDDSRQMYAALQAIGSGVRYTEYESVGHDAWDPAYAEPELMPWLLAKSRRAP
jgi:predicted peptidase